MRVSKGAIAALAIGLVVVVLVTYFADEVRHFVSLGAWSTSRARAATSQVVEAIRNRDLATVQGFCGRQVRVAEADGKLSGLGMAGPMTPPPIPIEFFTPTAGADQAKITFQLAAMRGTATAELPGPDGSTVRFVLKRNEGKWLLVGAATTADYAAPSAPSKGGAPGKSPKGPATESGRSRGIGEAGPAPEAEQPSKGAPSKAKGDQPEPEPAT